MLSIDEQRNINKERAAQQQETITSLTEILDEKKADTEGGLNAQKLSITILNILLSGVETLFAKSRCDTAPILHLLGEVILYILFLSFLLKEYALLLHTCTLFDYQTQCRESLQKTKNLTN